MSSAQDKRNLIIEVASGLFSRYGYTKTSLDDIASAAQISKGTVYNYFASKEELFVNVLEVKAGEYFDTLAKCLDEIEGLEAKLRGLLHLPIKFIYENMPILLEGYQSLPFPYQQRVEDFRQHNRTKMMALLLNILSDGRKHNLLVTDIPDERLCEIIVDWFLIGYPCFRVMDMPRLLQRIERDHEVIIHMILHGILKRG